MQLANSFHSKIEKQDWNKFELAKFPDYKNLRSHLDANKKNMYGHLDAYRFQLYWLFRPLQINVA